MDASAGTSVQHAPRRRNREWCDYVDALAASVSEPLPKRPGTESVEVWAPGAYIPPVPQSLRQYLAEEEKSTVSAFDKVFKPQQTVEESLGMRPIHKYAFSDRLMAARLGESRSSRNFFAQFATETVSSEKRMKRVEETRMKPSFMPIIMVSPSVSAAIQMWNVQQMLEEGHFVAPHTVFTGDDGSTSVMSQQTVVHVDASKMLSNINAFDVKFRMFRCMSNPALVNDWSQVCACLCTGDEWQFDKWYNGDKAKADVAQLFADVKGFLTYFEEDNVPKQAKEWHVTPLVISRKQTKMYGQIRVANSFWEQLFKFLDTHPFFRQFTLAHAGLDDGASELDVGASVRQPSSPPPQ